MIVNVDLDNVLYDFHSALEGYVRSVEPERWLRRSPFTETLMSAPAPTQWEFWNDWNMSYGEWRSWFRRGVEAGQVWWQGDPLLGAVEYMWRISDDGHDIRIVTDRLVHKFSHKLAVEATVNWLDDHNIPYRYLAFEKNKHIFADRFSVLVDDKLDNVLSFARFHPYLGKVEELAALFVQPWNQSAETAGLARVRSWEEVYAWTQQMSEAIGF